VSDAACQVCGKPLQYAGTGRPPRYCSERCKAKAKRRRGRRFGAGFGVPKASLRGAFRGTRENPKLAAALERVRKAEQQLADAKAARAASTIAIVETDLPPEVRTYDGQEWLQARREGRAPRELHQAGGPVGIDTGEVAARIERDLGASADDQRAADGD
jgi:hypothetical protein